MFIRRLLEVSWKVLKLWGKTKIYLFLLYKPLRLKNFKFDQIITFLPFEKANKKYFLKSWSVCFKSHFVFKHCQVLTRVFKLFPLVKSGYFVIECIEKTRNFLKLTQTSEKVWKPWFEQVQIKVSFLRLETRDRNKINCQVKQHFHYYLTTLTEALNLRFWK